MHERAPCKNPSAQMRWCEAYLHSWQTFIRHIARLDHGLGRSPPPRSIAERVIVSHGAAQASRGRCCGLSRCGAGLQPEVSAPCASQAPARWCASGYSWQRRSKAHTKMSNCQPLHSSKQSAVCHGTGPRDFNVRNPVLMRCARGRSAADH